MIYRHYKGDLYRLLFTALESTNGRPREKIAVYVSLKTGEINCRRYVEFFEVLELPSGAKMPRFDWVGERVP